MSAFLLIAYYLLPPVAASFAALWGAKYFNDWRGGMLAGSLAGMIATLLVSVSYWSDTDVCDYCNNGVAN